MVFSPPWPKREGMGTGLDQKAVAPPVFDFEIAPDMPSPGEASK
jgi:hypothetical protein